MLQVEAQKVLDQVTLIERGLGELNNLQRGELKLGSSLTIGNYWLPDRISRFKRRYPGIKVKCTLGNTEVIIAGTIAGLFDLSFVEGEVKPSDLACLELKTVGSDRLEIVVGKSHPWYKRTQVPLPELSKTAWVMREEGSGTRQRFEQALRDWRIEPTELTVILEMSSGEMVKAVVESGVGAAAISELMVKKELQLDTLHSIPVTDCTERSAIPVEIVRPFFLLKHRQRFQTRISQAFEKILVQ